MRRVFTYRNRHALALLGVYVLGHGLVVAPLWHAVVAHAGAALALDSPWVHHAATAAGEAEHDHAQAHTHGGPPHAHPPPPGEEDDRPPGGGHTHAPGALEHLATVFVAARPPAPIVLASAAPLFRAPEARPAPGGGERHPAMPQGP